MTDDSSLNRGWVGRHGKLFYTATCGRRESLYHRRPKVNFGMVGFANTGGSIVGVVNALLAMTGGGATGVEGNNRLVEAVMGFDNAVSSADVN